MGNGGIRVKKLANKAARQDSARAGVNSGKNHKKNGGPVTISPNPDKLVSSNAGCKATGSVGKR